MTERPPPYSHSFDLAKLGDAEREIVLSPNEPDRAAIAAWAGIDALDTFTATVLLRRTAPDLFSYDAEFSAGVVQSCVVTLEPVRTAVEGAVERQFRLLPRRARRHVEDEGSAAVSGDDDSIETLATSVLDVAAPVLEEFLLAIDPYPRAPDAAFETLSDSDETAKPFAKLAKLKEKP